MNRLPFALFSVLSLSSASPQAQSLLTYPPVATTSWLPAENAAPRADGSADAGSTHASASAEAGQPYSIWRDLFACDVPADRRWSFEFGVGVVSDNTISDYTEPRLNKLHGPGGGVTYNFTVAREIHQFAWNVGSLTFRPGLEVPGRARAFTECAERGDPRPARLDRRLRQDQRRREFPRVPEAKPFRQALG